MNTVWIAGGIFLFTYALIVSERVHRTISALLGGVAMILFGVLPQAQAFHAVDWNVIFLLAAMMIIANVLKETGLFQWIALQAVRLGKGDPFRVLVILSLITAITSAFLDNVTIVVLVAPVTLFVASNLRVNPVPFLIAEILASNIGGMATLVGDPPNILIGSAAGIDFLTFIANMGPISVIILLAFIGLSRFLFKNDLKNGKTASVDLQSRYFKVNHRSGVAAQIIDCHGRGHCWIFVAWRFAPGASNDRADWGNPPDVLGQNDPHHLLREIEWTTLFFFFGLFITVEAIVEVGFIETSPRPP